MTNHIKNILSIFSKNYFDIPNGSGRVLLFIFIESLAVSFLFLVSIHFSKNLHFNQFQIGRLISTMLAGTFVGSILSGYLARVMLSTTISSIGFLILGISFLLLAVTSKFIVLSIVMFWAGVGSVFMMIANLTMLVQLTKNIDMRNRVVVLQSVVFNATASIVALILSFLCKKQLICFFLITAALLFIASLSTANINEVKKNRKSHEKNQLSFRENRSKLFLLVFMVSCYGLVFAVVKTYFAVDVTSRFDNKILAWLVLSTNPILVIFVQPALINMLKGYDAKLLMFVSVSMLSSGFLFFGISSLLIPSVIFVTLATLGEMIFAPISKTFASTFLGSGNEGVGFAIWKVSYYLSGVFGASVSGYIGHYYGHQKAWSICALLLLCVIIYYLFYCAQKGVLGLVKREATIKG